jgi:hypothetical protein
MVTVMSTKRFKVTEGFADIDGKTYKAGDVVESSYDLASAFRNKFEEIHEVASVVVEDKAPKDGVKSPPEDSGEATPETPGDSSDDSDSDEKKEEATPPRRRRRK